MSTPLPPSISVRALGDMLIRLRHRKSLSRIAAAEYLGCRDETIRRWELGHVRPNLSRIRDLADLYDATPEERARMISLLSSSQRRGLFEDANLRPDMRYMYESELASQLIRSVELENIPGLLQTPEYHQVNQAAQLSEPSDFEESLRALRSRRQQLVFGQQDPPELRWVIGVAALFYLRSAPEIEQAQLARLCEVDDLPNAQIRVVTTFHPSMLGSYTLITPRGLDHSFLYLESLEGGRYIETDDVVSRHESAFDSTYAVATPLKEFLNGTR